MRFRIKNLLMFDLAKQCAVAPRNHPSVNNIKKFPRVVPPSHASRPHRNETCPYFQPSATPLDLADRVHTRNIPTIS